MLLVEWIVLIQWNVKAIFTEVIKTESSIVILDKE